MNIGLMRERIPGERRVALTPKVVASLVERGNLVWVEAGAGEGAMFPDARYARAGASMVDSGTEVARRCELIAAISVPPAQAIEACRPGTAVMAFFRMAVTDRALLEKLLERGATAIGYEAIRLTDGRHPVLAAVSEIAGQMTVPLAAHLLRSSSGGPGIMMGGSAGVAPAHFVVLGAGVVGTWAARTAIAAGARVTAFDIDAEKLRRLREHLPGVATGLAERQSIAEAVAAADVLIGAVLVAGSRAPHLVTREMVQRMKPGSVIIDLAIDQGGCVETSRPTSLLSPTFVAEGVTHYCVPNLTADMSLSASAAIAHAVLPYLVRIAAVGLEAALQDCPELARGVYTDRGRCVPRPLADMRRIPRRPPQEARKFIAAGSS